MRVLCVFRKDGTIRNPEPDEPLQAGDRLLVEGRLEDLEILRGLEELQLESRAMPDLDLLESERVGVVETVLSPHTTLIGRTLRQLNFREKYGLNVLAIWRHGRAFTTRLRDLALNFGDALLLYGPREKLTVLGREPDFIVLTGSVQEMPRLEKSKTAIAIMAAVFVPVLFGWIPIYIATVVGAALMVLSRCLTMEEAYRSIEWKAVFLIAGLLPLGTALERSGTARYLAEAMVDLLGPAGPTAVMFGILILTFLATCFVPTAALVVLMVPIVLSTSAKMGVSAHGLMMAVAMAASASFITPVAHPANLLVMGPGGYRFGDYVKIGGLLTIVVLAVLMLVMPVFWPLVPR
jgi:di/tricarboxylate transporter